MKHYAVVVAGGSGNRMGSELPKQFLLLAGRPLLMHTLEAFSASSYAPEIILVLHPEQQERWAGLCDDYNFSLAHSLAPAGTERYDSVRNALSLVSEAGVVAVHDAARPLVSPALIDRCFAAAAVHGNAVAAVRATDSIRISDAGCSRAVDRQTVYLVQTPQVFKSDQLVSAYNLPYQPGFTDDASVVEAAGTEIYIEEGERENFKITFPADLVLAEAIFATRQ